MYLEGYHTRRLKFRKLEKSDYQGWLEFFDSEEALRYLALGVKNGTQCEEWIGRQLLRYERDGMGLMALIEKSSGKLIGQAGLLRQKVDGRNEIETGYHIIPRFQSVGYATEAASACFTYAFDNCLTESVISIIHKDNFASQRVAVKNGLKKEKQILFRGFPVFIYRVKKEDWKLNSSREKL